jgi:hypothetical protein
VRDVPVYRKPGLGDKGLFCDFPIETISVYLSAHLVLAAAIALAGCGEPVGEYLPVSAIARGGFVSDEGTVAEMHGREVRLWGFVDQGNLYGDAEAKRVLGEWWSGEGPDPRHWRFDLKAEADDPVGHSLAVLVPNDARREDLLGRFVADAQARRATKIFVIGRLSTFPAPAQTRNLTGLILQLRSSQDIRLDSPGGD